MATAGARDPVRIGESAPGPVEDAAHGLPSDARETRCLTNTNAFSQMGDVGATLHPVLLALLVHAGDIQHALRRNGTHGSPLPRPTPWGPRKRRLNEAEHRVNCSEATTGISSQTVPRHARVALPKPLEGVFLVDFQHSSRARSFKDKVRAFIQNEILPVEHRHFAEMAARHLGADWTRWSVSPEVTRLKEKARSEGLWNLFLPDAQKGAGLSTVEYAPLAEEMGTSLLAPEIFNCNAPDSGNMEVLWKYGSQEQKEQWLEPLLAGKIRSAFCMTEPDVASSDATNMRATARLDGESVVLDGRKWWSSGVGHPDCKVAIFMGVTDGQADRHRQHSMVLVPLDTPGVKIERMLPVFGEYDEPYGHGEVSFDNVRVPRSNLIGGPGMGFEIAQGRLGPGRIHHCMRCIGAAERALRLMIERGLKRVAFGKPLLELGGNRERIADARIAIDQARLLTLHAAWRLDEVGAIKALHEISAIKVVAPTMLQQVVDEAIQMHGGAGVSNDVPLTALFALARVLRIADGPDAVHRALIAKMELAKYKGASREKA
jgi:acyl-CoA dehydrogenase